MPTSFQEIMSFSETNARVFDEIKRNMGQLLPFVGAGLTASVYGTWPAALRSLGKALDASARDELDRLLEEGQYLDAAQFLEDKRGRNNLRQDLVAHFSPDKLGSSWASVKREAVYLLPLLFGERPIVTTNFDQALEEVYQAHGLGLPALGPTEDELVNTAKKLMNTACVFKLHGTVTGQMMAYDKLVLTKAQYERHYGPTDPVRRTFSQLAEKHFLRKHPVLRTLRAFASSRSLFFLGCSLEKDRTVEVLRQAGASGGPSFAIVSCKPDERDRRLRELDDLNIRAILFEDGKYESVRIVLETLLQELNPNAFQRLTHKLSVPSPGAPSHLYKYDSGMTPLIGRDEEMRSLIEFVTSTDDPFLWWALTGPGGSGKSRLALELKERIESSYDYRDWRCHRLEAKDYGHLSDYLKPSRYNTLVIADYVQAHAYELGACMGNDALSARTGRLRLLLVERDGISLNQSYTQVSQIAGVDWQRQLFDCIPHYKQDVLERCWNRQFLRLEPLREDAHYLEIVRQFATKLRESGVSDRDVPTEAERTELLEVLRSVDRGLCRPLYLLFITGTFMSGEDPTHWSREKILDRTISNERNRLDERIREVMYPVYGNAYDGYNEALRRLLEACLGLYRTATALLGKPEDVIKACCPNEWHVLCEEAQYARFADAKELLALMGLVRDGEISTMEPDIMGEYFVYSWLFYQATEDQMRAFLSTVWDHELESAIFFDRLFTDLGYLLNEKPEQWTWLLPPTDKSASIDDPALRAMLLVNVTLRCRNAGTAKSAVDRIAELQRRFSDNREVALALAQGLFNLSNWQDAAESEVTLERIERLISPHRPRDPRVALLLAQGLFNLSNKQAATVVPVGIIRSIGELRERGFEDDQDIALVLARGLTNLTYGQDVTSVEGIVGQIEELRAQGFEEHPGIALALAKALVNLSYDQGETAATRTLARAERLRSSFAGDCEMAATLARGYVSLASKQDAVAATSTVRRIGGLYNEFASFRDVALSWTKGLLLLALKQDVDEPTARGAVERLQLVEKDFAGIVDEAIVETAHV